MEHYNGTNLLEKYLETDTEMTDVPNDWLAKSEMVNIPEVGDVVVNGDPFEIGKKLDENQGDNVYGFTQDCGLVSVHNILTMAGITSTEDEVVGRAILFRKCQTRFLNAADSGGTTVLQRQSLLETYGISSTFYSALSEEGSLESIASYVEEGRGVNLSGNAGYLWDEPSYIGKGASNHSIVVTGTARDPETGELKGLYVCDSGLTGESSAVFLSVEKLKDAYLDAKGASVLVTDKPIR